MKTSILGGISRAATSISSMSTTLARSAAATMSNNSSHDTPSANQESAAYHSSNSGGVYQHSSSHGMSIFSSNSSSNAVVESSSAPSSAKVDDILQQKLKTIYENLISGMDNMALRDIDERFNSIAENMSPTSTTATAGSGNDGSITSMFGGTSGNRAVASAPTKTGPLLPLEKFVMDAIKRGFEPFWCDAAYRAFTSAPTHLGMTFDEYFLAIASLDSSFQRFHPESWVALRRILVFNYYDRQNRGSVNVHEFSDFLDDISTDEGLPELFGIRNKLWVFRPNNFSMERADPENMNSLIQLLAKSRIESAQKQLEIDELKMKHRMMEKQMCDLKLELAKIKSSMED